MSNADTKVFCEFRKTISTRTGTETYINIGFHGGHNLFFTLEEYKHLRRKMHDAEKSFSDLGGDPIHSPKEQ